MVTEGMELIRLTRFRGDPVYVNADLIETVEQAPDTVVFLVSGNRLTVRETPDEIADLVQGRRECFPYAAQ